MLDIAAFMDNQTILIEKLADQGPQDRHEERLSISQNAIVDLSAQDPSLFAGSSWQPRRTSSPHQQYNSKQSNQTSSFQAADGHDMRYSQNERSKQQKQESVTTANPAVDEDDRRAVGSK